MNEEYSIVWLCHVLCISSSAYGHLSCFRPLATVNNECCSEHRQTSIFCPFSILLGSLSWDCRSPGNSRFHLPTVRWEKYWSWSPGSGLGHLSASPPQSLWQPSAIYILYPFSTWGNWGLGRFCNLPQITNPWDSGRVWTPESLLLTTTRGSLPPKSHSMVAGRGHRRQLGETLFLMVLFTQLLSRAGTNPWLVVQNLNSFEGLLLFW